MLFRISTFLIFFFVCITPSFDVIISGRKSWNSSQYLSWKKSKMFVNEEIKRFFFRVQISQIFQSLFVYQWLCLMDWFFVCVSIVIEKKKAFCKKHHRNEMHHIALENNDAKKHLNSNWKHSSIGMLVAHCSLSPITIGRKHLHLGIFDIVLNQYIYSIAYCSLITCCAFFFSEQSKRFFFLSSLLRKKKWNTFIDCSPWATKSTNKKKKNQQPDASKLTKYQIVSKISYRT